MHQRLKNAEAAYGACIYVRSTDNLGNITSKLLCSKSRVAPLKQLTIPKLELCAASLLSKLMSSVLECSNINFDFLSKIFVANRVAQIQSLRDHVNWKYLNTSDNPADLMTKGMDPKDLSYSKLWFEGPSWLSNFSIKLMPTNGLSETQKKSNVFISIIHTF